MSCSCMRHQPQESAERCAKDWIAGHLRFWSLWVESWFAEAVSLDARDGDFKRHSCWLTGAIAKSSLSLLILFLNELCIRIPSKSLYCIQYWVWQYASSEEHFLSLWLVDLSRQTPFVLLNTADCSHWTGQFMCDFFPSYFYPQAWMVVISMTTVSNLTIHVRLPQRNRKSTERWKWGL